MTDLAPPRLSLWLIAHAFLTTLFNLFGAPEAIAARHTLVRKDATLLARWLRAGEALLRQLLMLEAAALPKPKARAVPRAKHARTRRVVGFSAEAPEAWRVSFRCSLADPRPSTGSGRREQQRQPERVEGDAARFCSAWPLAERAEALLRVFNDPAPYAARLARRLYAHPERARAMLAHPPDLPPLVGADSFAHAYNAALLAVAVFDTG